MDHAWHDADGLPVQIEYGDLAHTTTDFGHDDRRRLRTVQTYRGPPVEWTAPPVSYSPAPNLNGSDKVFQSILEDAEYLYDDVDNPTEIRDWRNPTVWPDGAKPVTQKAQYDDLYRLTKIQYQYTAGDDTWTDPYAPEHTGTTDTRRGAPSPEVSFGKRVLQQSYQYDWLGNLTDSQDDAKGFYDRSLGAQTHSGTKPYQLTSATGSASTRDGNLTLAYDAAGNMSSLALVRNGPCLPSNATCSQRFAYDWDEVGRLGRARRWDQVNPGLASDPLPQTTPAVELKYTYDASDGRVLKTAVDASSNERHTAYIFGSLELRGTTWDGSDFADTKDTEVAYLFAHGVRLARLHYSEDSLPTLTSGKLHVLLELPDHLGSSSVVVDRETGELVEKSSYQAYGNPDSDYRPARWSGFREDYRFTGKEEDVEVGVQYFGKRYLAASLGRWLSPDPLAVHSPGSADLNLYAYVHGDVLQAVDPLGLQDNPDANPEVASDAPSSVPMDVRPPGMDFDVEDAFMFAAGAVSMARGLQNARREAIDNLIGTPMSDRPHPPNDISDPNQSYLFGGFAVGAGLMWAGLGVGIHDQPGELQVPDPGDAFVNDVKPALASLPKATTPPPASQTMVAAPPPGPTVPPPPPAPAAVAAQARVDAFSDAAGKAMKGSGSGGSFAADAHPTFAPGPYAGESIPARSADQTFTIGAGSERERMNEILKDTGCHSCGATVAGTKSGNAIPDHQPISALNFDNRPQLLFPHCLQCSREQGLAVAEALRALKRSQ